MGCDSCNRNASPASSARACRRMLTNQSGNNLPRRGVGRRQLNVLCLIAEAVAWRPSCFDPGPFGVATFLPFRASLNFVRPVTPQVAGSSPSLPRGKSMTWRNLGPIGYKSRPVPLQKFTAFVLTFFRLRPTSRAASPTLTAATSTGLLAASIKSSPALSSCSRAIPSRRSSRFSPVTVARRALFKGTDWIRHFDRRFLRQRMRTHSGVAETNNGGDSVRVTPRQVDAPACGLYKIFSSWAIAIME